MTLETPEIRAALWDNRGGPRGAGNTIEGLTHSLDLGKEELPMNGTRICSVDDCMRVVHSHGWCHAHYQRWRRLGDVRSDVPLSEKRPGSICAIDGCGRFVRCRGWCGRHYDRWRSHGDPMKGSPVQGTTKPGVDLSGSRYGRLTVIEYASSSQWLCRCTCGVVVPVSAWRLLAGITQSCGCIKRERSADASYVTVHRWVSADRGRARGHACVECGGRADTWSYDHKDPDERRDDRGRPFSLDVQHYDPRCYSCHAKFDNATKAEEWDE